MHAASFLPLELSINESNFHVIPPWLVAFVASWIALRLIRRYGRNITPQESKVADLLLDLTTLFTAGSLIASISATPLVTSLVTSINRNISEWVVGGIRIGDIVIVGGVLLTLVVLFLGYAYTKSEKGWTLFWFGLSLQVAAVFAPWINTILSWWINHIIAPVWNFILWVVTFLPSIQINF